MTREVLSGQIHVQWLEMNDDGAILCTLELTVPPLPCAGTSARATWNTWRNHSSMKVYRALKRDLLQLVLRSGGTAYDLDIGDNASGNDLFWNATCQTDSPHWVKGRCLCMSHQTNHTSVNLFAGAYPLSYTSEMYNVAAYMAMGTHLLRTSLALMSFLKQPGIVQLEIGSPDEFDTLFATQLVDYLVSNATGLEDAPRLRWKEQLELQLSLWNSGFRGSSGTLIHRCSGHMMCHRRVVV